MKRRPTHTFEALLGRSDPGRLVARKRVVAKRRGDAKTLKILIPKLGFFNVTMQLPCDSETHI